MATYSVPNLVGAQGAILKNAMPNLVGAQAAILKNAMPNLVGAQAAILKSTMPNLVGAQAALIKSTMPNLVGIQAALIKSTMPTFSMPSLAAANIDALLAGVQSSVATELDEANDQASLARIWLESLADLRAWLSQPGTRAVTTTFAFFIITVWWINLKVYHPDVADLIEVPMWAAVALLLGIAVKK